MELKGTVSNSTTWNTVHISDPTGLMDGLNGLLITLQNEVQFSLSKPGADGTQEGATVWISKFNASVLRGQMSFSHASSKPPFEVSSVVFYTYES